MPISHVMRKPVTEENLSFKTDLPGPHYFLECFPILKELILMSFRGFRSDLIQIGLYKCRRGLGS